MSLSRDIMARLGGRWYGSEGGYGLTRCVSHDDHNPSLKLSDGDQGKLLVHCFAGCEPRDMLAELRRRHLLDGDGAGELDQERIEQQSRRLQAAAEQDRRRRTR